MKAFVTGCVLAFLMASFCFPARAFNRDPVKETQSEGVPVTDEMLKREGQAGPASPTFQMKDTAKFLVKTPLEEKTGDEAKEVVQEEKTNWWDEWFSWGGKKPKDKNPSN